MRIKFNKEIEFFFKKIFFSQSYLLKKRLERSIKNKDENELFGQFAKYCENYKEKINDQKEEKIKSSLSFLKNKAKTLEDIYNNSNYIIQDNVSINKDDLKLLDDKAKKVITEFSNNISSIEILNKENLEPIINDLIKSHETNFKGVGQPLRIVLTGSKFGPGIYDIITSLGKNEVMKRLSLNLKGLLALIANSFSKSLLFFINLLIEVDKYQLSIKFKSKPTSNFIELE